MKKIGLIVFGLMTGWVQAATTYYVDAGRSNDSGAGTSWATAKKTIQAAIDISDAGDTIIVTNGVYSPIRTANKAIAIRSVNGAAVTIIDGNGTTRCATLGTSNSQFDTVMTGFTLQSGYAINGGGAHGGTLVTCTLSGNTATGNGGGAYNSTLDNSTLTGNTAIGTSNYGYGGGAYGSTLNNCILTSNTARHGGGSHTCTLNNSTVSGNTITTSNGGAGSDGGRLNNCIVWENRRSDGTLANYYNNPTFLYSCTTPSRTGEGNIALDPLFVDAVNRDFRLREGSPCIDTGNNNYVVSNNDFDGNPRIHNGKADMGAYEFTTLTVTFNALGGSVSLVSKSVAVGHSYGALPTPMRARYTFGGWHIITSNGGAKITENTVVTMATAHTLYAHWTASSVTADLYVDASRPNDSGAGTSWATAKKTIQAAINASVAGDVIVVTNGTYASISTANKSISIRSVNGAAVTIIDGGGKSRCATLGADYGQNDTVLTGFTLQNGHTTAGGGGSYHGTLNNCTLTGNTAGTYGGGAFSGTLNNCVLTGNTADNGGGSYGGQRYNCTLTGNTAKTSGGGTYGVAGGTLRNCIVWGNSRSNGTTDNYNGGTFRYSCTTPLPSGTANITQNPLFVNAASKNFRLQENSPCINKGHNSYVPGATDIVGNPRIWNGTVDMGAYEWLPPLAESVNCPELTWTTGGTAPWFQQTQMTYDGLHAAQSGAITHNQNSWIETSVEGRGSLSFWWKVSSEGGWDWLTCITNGATAFRISGEQGWEQRTINLFSSGTTVIRWEFSKDDGDFFATGSDCGWLDEVSWASWIGFYETQTTPCPVPYVWLDMMYPDNNGDYETLAHSQGLNSYTVWGSYVAGLVPTNANSRLIAHISLVNGKPSITWEPDLRPERVYTVLGNSTLSTNGWTSPFGADARFFKVKVEMNDTGN